MLKILLPPPRGEQGATDKVWPTEEVQLFNNVHKYIYKYISVIGDHLSCKTTFAWQQGWSPIAGFTVLPNQGPSQLLKLH